MTERDGDAHRRDPGDTDPLLVRPFLGDAPSDSEQRWESERYRTIRSHRASSASPASPPSRPSSSRKSSAAASSAASSSAAASPSAASSSAASTVIPAMGNLPSSGSRKGRSAVLIGASAAAVIGLVAVGYGVFQPTGDDGDTPFSLEGGPPPAAVPSTSTGEPGRNTPAPGDATSATRPGGRTTPASPSASTTRTSPPAGTTTTPPVTPTSPGAPSSPSDERPALIPPALEAALSPPAAARVGTITADSNLCLDLNGGVPLDDNHIQVFDCNGTGAQRWTIATDGTLRVAGKCAQVTGNTTVHIIGCDRRETAQWRAGADNTLVNVGTGQCLTDAENRSGTGVRVTPCDGRDDQQWSLPG